MVDKKVLSLEDLEMRLDLMDGRISRLEKESLVQVSGHFELWMEKKLKNGAGKYYEYALELKKVVLPQCVGKAMEDCKGIFYRERDKMVKAMEEKEKGRAGVGVTPV